MCKSYKIVYYCRSIYCHMFIVHCSFMHLMLPEAMSTKHFVPSTTVKNNNKLFCMYYKLVTIDEPCL